MKEPTIVSLGHQPLKCRSATDTLDPAPIDIDQVYATMSDHSQVLLFALTSETKGVPDDDLVGLTAAQARDTAKAQCISSYAQQIGTAWAVRRTLSDYHLEAASQFARLSQQLEQDNALEKNQPGFSKTLRPEDPRYHHISYAIGAITTAYAAIEAAVAEAFITAYETFKHQPLSDMREALILAQLAAIWEHSSSTAITNTERLVKLALQFAGKSIADMPTWENVDSLRRFRNKIVHYREGSRIEFSTIPNVPVTKPHDFEDRLRSLRLDENPYAVSPDFPFRYFGYRTLEWAVTTARLFIKEFKDALPIPCLSARPSNAG